MDTLDPDTTPADVLTFWFGAYPLDAAAMVRVQGQWFRKDEAFDARLRERFGPAIAAARAGRLDAWAEQAEGRLALTVLLDQFTRNAFRGRPESFGGDAQALALALEGIARGHDQAVPPMARPFCYLPLEHCEDGEMQARSVALFEALATSPGAQPAPLFAANLDYARRHQDVIRRFGRFPHRNAILGRADTPDEAAYLAQPGAGF
ncbi:DUF924 family protein [Ottowia sp.]|jgi:uncharacterized protein (DUF924 family)|uniref:DUF924 family protein n=1 Tax=Ottowia sp. TaxID=1898956 RepID=UPI0025F51CFC|nr:DUF924 family protein [Ottowia sp.]MBK6613514.1 DUF924 domain-containing protein [Ottowia sp.]MBK6747381.1 DUF924 domain-containing protein [Ottowia sp.]